MKVFELLEEDTIENFKLSNNKNKEITVKSKIGYCKYIIEPNKYFVGYGNKELAVIWHLYIYPEYRKQGKAKEILKYIIDKIRNTGYKGDIGIQANPQENSISQRELEKFYKNLGLKILKENNWRAHGIVEDIPSDTGGVAPWTPTSSGSPSNDSPDGTMTSRKASGYAVPSRLFKKIIRRKMNGKLIPDNILVNCHEIVNKGSIKHKRDGISPDPSHNVRKHLM
jgi:predicted GNAT family acetyltransferase